MRSRAARIASLRAAGLTAEAAAEAVETEIARQASIQRAEQRAEQLLHSQLTPAQIETWDAGRYFDIEVRTRRGVDTWRIEEGRDHNVQLIGTPIPGQRYLYGKELAVRRATYFFCAGPPGGIPVADFVLAQKLWLESDMKEFLRIAL